MSKYYERNIMDAKAATGNGTSLSVREFDSIIVSIDSASSANLTVKCIGSIMDSEPAFTTQSVTDRFEFIEMVGQEDSTNVLTGDTGLALAGTDDHRQFMVNTEGLKWINFKCTAYTAGTITIYAQGFLRK